MVSLNFNANNVKPAQGNTTVEVPAAITPARAWSPMQQDVFTFVRSAIGNAVIEAVAGSGKSTTIIQAMNDAAGSTIFLAFNKAIAEELKSKGVNARTFHSLCFNSVLRHVGASNVDANKLRRLSDANLKGEETMLYGAFIQRLVGLGRQVGIGCLVPDTQAAWLDIVTHHNFELENEKADLGRALELASDLLTWSNASNMVDFDDLLYFAVKYGISLPKYDWVFVDEAQDTNAIQRALLRKIMKPNSRLIAVGDPSQAIYGFRGADSNSLNLLAEEFNCVRLPLSISYRCARSVVNFARQWVSHIEAAPNAPEGSVQDMGFEWTPEVFNGEDLVVCRTTKPIIALGFRMLKKRIPVRIMGKDIGAGLKSLIKKMNTNDIEVLQLKLSAYTAREVEKATAKMEDSKAEAIQDKTDAIMVMIDGLDEDSRNVPALLATIDQLFNEAVRGTTLSTIHKAKGLEASRVFWLNSSACPAKWVKQDWQRQQEVNLCYVAATRAKLQLVLIEERKER